jgi:hypothetical protein
MILSARRFGGRASSEVLATGTAPRDGSLTPASVASSEPPRCADALHSAPLELVRESVPRERLDSTEAHNGRALYASAKEAGPHRLAQRG